MNDPTAGMPRTTANRPLGGRAEHQMFDPTGDGVFPRLDSVFSRRIEHLMNDRP
jgi:hypothetical protein